MNVFIKVDYAQFDLHHKSIIFILSLKIEFVQVISVIKAYSI